MSHNNPAYGDGSARNGDTDPPRPIPPYPVRDPTQFSGDSNSYGQIPPDGGWGGTAPGGYYGGGVPPYPQPPMNTMSVVGFILAFLLAPVGAILSHIARDQIKRSGERGEGLALAGIIIGWTQTAVAVLGLVVFFAVGGFLFSMFTQTISELETEVTASAVPDEDTSEDSTGTSAEPNQTHEASRSNPLGGKPHVVTPDKTDGAVASRDLNAPHCDAVNEVLDNMAGLDSSDQGEMQEIAGSYDRLADVYSDPSATELYREYAGALRDPVGNTDVDFVELSEEAAEQLGQDIVSCDIVQVY